MKLCMISFSVAPMDYIQNTPVTLQFENCNMTQCHCIPIVDDDVLEGNETFYVTLEAADDLERDNIVLDPVNGTIEIVDDEIVCKQVWSVFCDCLYLDTDSCTMSSRVHFNV